MQWAILVKNVVFCIIDENYVDYIWNFLFVFLNLHTEKPKSNAHADHKADKRAVRCHIIPAIIHGRVLQRLHI